MSQEFLKCPICGHTNEQHNFPVLEADCRFIQIEGIDQHLVRHQCLNCDVIFGTQQILHLPKEKLIQAYEKHYATGYQEGDCSDFQITTFMKFNPTSNGVYVDWGAGSSGVSRILRSRGYNVMDYDPFLEKMSPNRYNTTEQVFNTKFDGIMSNSVIEHLQDPVTELVTMKSLLKPGAFMIHTTDCFQYRVEWTKYHLFFFVGKSLSVLADKAGLVYEYVDDMRAKFTPKD